MGPVFFTAPAPNNLALVKEQTPTLAEISSILRERIVERIVEQKHPFSQQKQKKRFGTHADSIWFWLLFFGIPLTALWICWRTIV